jgi:hypothetical protein
LKAANIDISDNINDYYKEYFEHLIEPPQYRDCPCCIEKNHFSFNSNSVPSSPKIQLSALFRKIGFTGPKSKDFFEWIHKNKEDFIFWQQSQAINQKIESALAGFYL